MYLNFESWLLTRNLAISRALKELVNVKAVLTFYRDPAAPAPAAHYTTHYKMVEHGKPLFQMHHSAHNTSSYTSSVVILSSQLLSTLRWHPARARDTKSAPQSPERTFLMSCQPKVYSAQMGSRIKYYAYNLHNSLCPVQPSSPMLASSLGFFHCVTRLFLYIKVIFVRNLQLVINVLIIAMMYIRPSR